MHGGVAIKAKEKITKIHEWYNNKMKFYHKEV